MVLQSALNQWSKTQMVICFLGNWAGQLTLVRISFLKTMSLNQFKIVVVFENLMKISSW